jgi:hypothetical protein
MDDSLTRRVFLIFNMRNGNANEVRSRKIQVSRATLSKKCNHTPNDDDALSHTHLPLTTKQITFFSYYKRTLQQPFLGEETNKTNNELFQQDDNKNKNTAVIFHYACCLKKQTTKKGMATTPASSSSSMISKIQRRVWEGSLPLEIRLASADSRTFDQGEVYLVCGDSILFYPILLHSYSTRKKTPQCNAFFTFRAY